MTGLNTPGAFSRCRQGRVTGAGHDGVDKRKPPVRYGWQEDLKPIDKNLLDILACPKCKGELVMEDDQSALVCNTCRVKYRIEDDIPIMLIDEATPL